MQEIHDELQGINDSGDSGEGVPPESQHGVDSFNCSADMCGGVGIAIVVNERMDLSYTRAR